MYDSFKIYSNSYNENFKNFYSRRDAFCRLIFAYIILALALCAACKSIALVDLTPGVPRSEEKLKKELERNRKKKKLTSYILNTTVHILRRGDLLKASNEKVTITMTISGSLENWNTRLTIRPWQGRSSSERAMGLTRSLMQIFRTTFIR